MKTCPFDARLMAVALAFVVLPSAANAQKLTDEQVQQALATAKNNDDCLRLSEAFNLTDTGYVVRLCSPIGFIQAEAARAKKEMRPFGIADVTDELREDVWRLTVWPNKPTKMNQTQFASSVDHVVLRNKDKSIIIQPLNKEPFPDAVQNLMGASLSYNGMHLSFPGAGVAELWGPRRDREFIISVIGENWKYDFTIKKKHFEKLQ